MRGFTLIELLVVISIIGILSALILPNFLESQAQARDQERMATLMQIKFAVERYRADNGSLPDVLGDLVPVYLDSAPSPEYSYNRSSSDGIYIITNGAVEELLIMDSDQDFACPQDIHTSAESIRDLSHCSDFFDENESVYAVYSEGVRSF